MTDFTPLFATLGGAMIGLAAVLLMATLGRIAGISGIVGGLTTADGNAERGWRLAFLLGLIGTPAVIGLFMPALMHSEFTVSLPLVILAGVVVGIGTTLGNGCTSGHGVCGTARLSMRSLLATMTFMSTGVATTFLVRHILGGAP